MSDKAFIEDHGFWKGTRPTVEELCAYHEWDKAECDCCGMSGVTLKTYELTPPSRRWNECKEAGHPPYQMLCHICANTPIGTWNEYPDGHDRDVLGMMRMLAYVGNRILRQLSDNPR
jgi:hypothetical protein